MNMKQEALVLVDLESQLRNDTTGARSAEVLDRLRALRDNCQAARRQLCDKTTYRRLEAATIAVNAAIRVIEALPRGKAGGN